MIPRPEILPWKSAIPTAVRSNEDNPGGPRVAVKATLVALSRVLLNLDEFVTRD